MNLTRRGLLASSAAATSLFALGACEGVVESTGTQKAKDGILTVGADVGQNNLFIENFNNYNNSSVKAPGMQLVLQTLSRISTKNGLAIEPMLAESVTYEDGGRKATYKLRQDVTWSDGERFDADDVIFSFGAIFGKPVDDPGNLGTFLNKAPERVDDFTVTNYYNFPNAQQDTNLCLYYPMLPEHIFGGLDDEARKKLQVKSPIGTGPLVLESFQPQRVTYTVRDDYWGDKIENIKKVEFVPEGTPAVVQSNITSGDIDWAEGGGPGVQAQFLEMAETNRFEFFPNGGARGVLFNCKRAPFDNKDLRIAFRDAVDPTVIQKSVNIGAPIPSAGFLVLELFKETAVAPWDKPLTRDVESAKAAFKRSGFTVENGNLVKNGKTYKLTIDQSLNQPTDSVAAPVLISQWQEILGVEVKLNALADQKWSDQLKKHDFDLTIHNLAFGGSPYNVYQAYLRENLLPKPQAAGYGNQGRWDIGAEADDWLHEVRGTSRENGDVITELLKKIAVHVAEEAPGIPYQAEGAPTLQTVKNWTGFPTVAESDYAAQADYSSGVKVLQGLKPA